MNFKDFTVDTIRRDALAGTVTGMIAVPLTIGICLMSEYPIQTGLITVVFACVVSFVTFLFRPGNYVGTPGVAAGLAPVLALSIHKFGMENMPFLIFLTATSQAIAWRYDLQKYILRAIPSYLIEGLLAGIGLKIALKFLPYTYEVLQTSGEWLDNERIKSILISLSSLFFFLYLFKKYKSTFPAVPYVAIILTGVVLAMYVPLPMLHVEEVPLRIALPFPNFDTLPPALLLELVGYALMLSLIDVIEQVTSNSAIEKLDPFRRPANTNNSLLAIWIANMGSSFFGGMTNLDGLAKSATNALAGAVTKLSNLFTAAVLLVFILFPQLLTHLPEYSLAVLMMFTGWKMIAGLVHVASHGKYALILALFCGILVFEIGIFEGLLIVLVIHGLISFVIYKHEQMPILKILTRFIDRFTDQVHPETTTTMLVHKDGPTGGLVYTSIQKNPADKKNLNDFINDWAFGVNQHSIPGVVSTYDYQGLLWGTFAKELREGHNNIKKYFEHLFEMDRVSVHFESGEVRQYKDIFIRSGKYVFTYYKKDDKVEVPARYSFVCKKEKTGWYILEHHSSEFPL
jgi:MFS superfamily sulfate permease-like transporter